MENLKKFYDDVVFFHLEQKAQAQAKRQFKAEPSQAEQNHNIDIEPKSIKGFMGVRNIKIIDNSHTQNSSFKEFKVLGQLSQNEKKLLRAIKHK